MFSSPTRRSFYRPKCEFAYLIVIVLSALLLSNLAINLAWADKGGNEGGKGKGHDKAEPGQAKQEEKGQSGKESTSNGDGKGDNQSSNGNTQESKKTPPPTQNEGSPPNNPSPSDAGNKPTDSHPSTPTSSQPSVPPSDSIMPPDSATLEKSAADSLALNDNIEKTSVSYHRTVSDSVNVGDGKDDNTSKSISIDRVIAPVLTESQLRITDHITTSGLVTSIPAPPKITVTSPAILQVLSDQSAEINFDSTSSGTYSIAISSDGPAGLHYSQAVSGNMQSGSNSVSWDGKKASGELVPAGKYLYFITATGEGGIRQPPQNGDGSIVVIGPEQVSSPLIASLMNPNYFIISIIGGAVAALVGLIYFKRKRQGDSFTLYIPVESDSIVSDIKDVFPEAMIGDYYLEQTSEGPKRYQSITFPRPPDAGDQWQEVVIERIKEIAPIDSVA